METRQKRKYWIFGIFELLIIGLLLISAYLPFAFINMIYEEQYVYFGYDSFLLSWRIVGFIFIFISSLSLFFLKINTSNFSGLIGLIVIGMEVLLIAYTIQFYATSFENKIYLVGFYLDLVCLLVLLGINIFKIIILKKSKSLK